jgi:hypothetical protein
MEILSALTLMTYIKIFFSVLGFIGVVYVLRRIKEKFIAKWNLIDDSF